MKNIPPLTIIEHKKRIKEIIRQVKRINKTLRSNTLCMIRLYRLMNHHRAKGHHRSANYQSRIRSRVNRDNVKLIRATIELHTELYTLGRAVVHIRQGITH